MRQQAFIATLNPLNSFTVVQEPGLFCRTQPHSHQETEIVYIRKGEGKFITGNNIIPFTSGDIIIAGSYLPHQFAWNPDYIAADGRIQGEAIAVHFHPDFMGDTFLNLSENVYIKVLLEKARKGIILQDEADKSIAAMMQKMSVATGTRKLIILLEVLYSISQSENLNFLTTGIQKSDSDELQRIENVYKYTLTNFNRKIDLEEIAAVAYVSPHSFCRFFKSKTQKTYSRFLIELRVKHACNLLIESRLCSKRICSESGFNTFSNFHKCFKEITGKSPLEYQRDFKAIALYA